MKNNNSSKKASGVKNTENGKGNDKLNKNSFSQDKSNRKSNAKSKNRENFSYRDSDKNGGDTKIEKTPDSSKMIHQLMPYFLFVIAIFLFSCFVLIDIFRKTTSMGYFGIWLRDFFCGLFGPSAFFAPAFIAFFGAFWKKAIEQRQLLSKFLLSISILTLLSTFIHVCKIRAGKSLGYSFPILWNAGCDLNGGGVVGGYFGELFYTAFAFAGSLIIILSLILIFIVFFFGLTPSYIYTFVKYKMKLRAEKKIALQVEKEQNSEISYRTQRLSESAVQNNAHRDVEIPQKDESAILSDEKVSDVYADDHLINEKPFEDDIPVEEIEPYKEVEIQSTSKDAEFKIQDIFKEENSKKENIPLAIENSEKSASEDIPTEASVDLNLEVNLTPITDIESEEELEDEEEPEKAVATEQLATYIFPPYDLLDENNQPKEEDTKAELVENAAKLVETLKSFKIQIKGIDYSRGPTITRYEIKPEAGVRVRAIANLVDDIAMSLATTGVRIEAPIPNKPAVGVEVPNRNRATVFLRDLIESDKFSEESSRLTACLGMDVAGKPIYFNIAKMPHMLIAGATGMGKSVCINSIIVSLLYKATPQEVKLILIDPKKVEFNIYKDIPHLYAPIVSEPKKAAGALASAVAEMERRFELIEEVGVRDIYNYNMITAGDPEKEFMPQMVIIIDELADLMMTAPDEVESSICRLAQKARAAGIHLIIGTQRPSVDVITGLIKANIPSRIAFTVASQVDSRTIIDIAGAEKLIGRGDMLFAPVGSSKPMRVQGAFVSESEVEKIVEYIKKNNYKAQYNMDFINRTEEEAAKCGNGKRGSAGADDGDFSGDNEDPKFREAVELAIDAGKISTSLMQRMLGVGYGRAAKIIDRMQELGYVSQPDGNKPRKVLITRQEFMEKVINEDV